MITNYNKHFSGLNLHYKTSFELNNIPSCLANSLRRICISSIPTVTFNDKWEEDEKNRSIIINANTSVVNSELLKQRISLVPLNMANQELKIKTEYNNIDGIRNFQFANPAILPNFYLRVKNDSEDIVDVSNNNFTTDNNDVKKFMVYDYFTNQATSIAKLKPGEEIDLICKPAISIGRNNARNNPCCISFKNKIDTRKVEDAFMDMIEKMNHQRKKIMLEPYNEQEIKELRVSFDALGIDRVYYKNENDEANIFELSIESIGFMNPDQIFMDAIIMLKLTLKDVLNSIEIKNTSKKIVIRNNNKINFNSEENCTNITLKNETHTLGNLISSYLIKMFNETDIEENKILKYVSYQTPHPTLDEIQLVFIPFETDKDELIRIINKIMPKDTIQVDLLNQMLIEEIRDILSTLLMMRTINYICGEIDKLVVDFSSLSGLTSPSFNMDYKMEGLEKVFVSIPPKIKSEIETIVDTNPHIRQLLNDDCWHIVTKTESESDVLKVHPLDNLQDKLTSITKSVPYEETVKEDWSVLHYGQLKLFHSEVKLFIDYIDFTKPYQVVYAGSAAGYHLPFLSDMFPSFYFHLIDPNPFCRQLKKHNKFSLRNELFTDELALEYKTKYGSDNLIFISDIRSSPEEEYVKRDMNIQKKWIEIMDPILSMVKFRLPWSRGKTVYLRGDIQIQAYPRPRSTETRLVSTREMRNQGDFEYNNELYDAQCGYHNSVQRMFRYRHDVEYFTSKDNRLDHCYDCSYLVKTIKKYLEMTTKKTPTGKQIQQFLFKMFKSYGLNRTFDYPKVKEEVKE